MALEPLTGYTRALVPFFAAQRCARLTLLTKCADVENLLDLDHRGHTILSWSLNPPEVCRAFEANTPPVESRVRYPFERRVEVYRHLIRAISRVEPALPIALCLEETAVFQALGLTGSVGHCNCVL